MQSNIFLDFLYTLAFLMKRSLLGVKGFSQLGEDQVIMKFVPEGEGSFLDIGAGHPVRGSNTFQLYRRGWRGLAVDPLNSRLNQFKLWRKNDSFKLAAVGSQASIREFFHLFPEEYSTFDEIRAKFLVESGLAEICGTYQIPIVPVSSWELSTMPMNPFVLSLDIEGYDLEVLKSLNWSRFAPRVICVEEIEKARVSETESFLVDHRYSKVWRYEISAIYVHRDYLDSMTSEDISAH